MLKICELGSGENNESAGNVRAFWNSRAGLGQWAGTRDVIAKQIELAAIAGYVRDGMRILEVGCGNGITAIELARSRNVTILAIDYAADMIVAAKALQDNQQLTGSVRFQVGDVQSLAGLTEKFDLIYTERVLINLPDWPAQKKAIGDIAELLTEGGIYVMCENSQDGLDELNDLRARVDLPAIVAPWHNRYLRDRELEEINVPGLRLVAINYFSSTYYFLSRIVNASAAARAGIEPDYDAAVNQLALTLPAIGKFGQGRIWLWRKTASSVAAATGSVAKRAHG